MKILVVHNSYQQRGGEDVVVEQETDVLQSHGHEVVLYRRSNTEIRGYSPLAHLNLARTLIWATDSRNEVTNLLRLEKPDVVHVHNTFFMVSPSVYSACRDCGVPVVQTLHNYRLLCPEANLLRNGQPCELCVHGTLLHSIVHGCYRNSRASTTMVSLMLAVHRMRRTWVRMVDCYIALSNFARQKLIASGVPQDKLVVKANFVHPDPGGKSEMGSYALYVGRLSSEKGVDTLLEAWRQVKRPIPLRVVGEGPDSEKLKIQFQADSRIIFCGRRPRAEVVQLLKNARFVIAPSRCYENFPLIIAEAYACGLPVIASNLGAMSELVKDGRTGLLFRPGDATELAASAEWAWTHVADVTRMGYQCRAEFESKYSAEQNYKALMGIYQRVAGRTPMANRETEDSTYRPAA